MKQKQKTFEEYRVEYLYNNGAVGKILLVLMTKNNRKHKG